MSEPIIYPAGSYQYAPNLGLALFGADEVVTQNFLLIDEAFGGLEGTIQVNYSPIFNSNFVNSSSASFSVTGSNISLEINLPQTAAATSHKWLNSYTAFTGVFTETQPAFTDISGTATLSQLPSGISANILDMDTAGGTAPSPLFAMTLNIQSIAAANTTYMLTQATLNPGGEGVPATTTYTGAFSNGASNALAGNYFAISGFVNTGNNTSSVFDQGLCLASTGTSITLANTVGVNEINAGTATLQNAITTVAIPSTAQFSNNGGQGSIVVIAGATSAANNGTWVCAGSNATQLNLNNAHGVLQAGAMGAATVEDDLTGTNINPNIYVQDSAGYWHGQAGMDVTTPALGSGTEGTFTFGRRLFIRDNNLPYQQEDTNGNEYGTNPTNSLITVNHIAGRGTSTYNQDRAIWVNMTNDQNNSAPLYGMECLQMEMDIVGTITILSGAPPDEEFAVLSLQMSDAHTNSVGSPSGGVDCIRATYFRQAGASIFSENLPTVARIEFSNASSVDGESQAYSGITIDSNDGADCPNFGFIGILINAASPRFTLTNTGILIGGYGTNVNDYSIQSTGGQVLLNGPVGVASLYATDGAIAVAGCLTSNGLTVTALTGPGIVEVAPAVPGSTNYSYVLVAYDANGNGVAGSTYSITNGSTSLSATDSNEIVYGAFTIGAATIKLFRTVGGATQGVIHTFTPTANDYVSSLTSLAVFTDTGQVGDSSTPPSGNTTGSVSTPTIQMAAAVAGAPTSAGTAGTAGQIIYYSGLLYFCSVTGVAGSATWNKLSMAAV